MESAEGHTAGDIIQVNDAKIEFRCASMTLGYNEIIAFGGVLPKVPWQGYIITNQELSSLTKILYYALICQITNQAQMKIVQFFTVHNDGIQNGTIGEGRFSPSP